MKNEKHWEVRSLDQRQPGDVIVRNDAHGASNIGIAGPDNSVFVNRRDGIFIQTELQFSNLHEKSFVLHPPEKK